MDELAQMVHDGVEPEPDMLKQTKGGKLKLKLKPAPLMWTLGHLNRPDSTELDGLRFTLHFDSYGDFNCIDVSRAADNQPIERVHLTRGDSINEIIRAWDLEEWRAREEAAAIRKAEAALKSHRDAMTRLNFVRSIRI